MPLKIALVSRGQEFQSSNLLIQNIKSRVMVIHHRLFLSVPTIL